MRRPALMIAALLVLSLAVGVWAAGKTVSIQVRQSQVRSKPSYLSKVVGKLSYGDSPADLGRKGEWLKVKSKKGLTGWVHASAVTDKKIILSSGKTKADLKASDEELILAGKGFNKEVEGKYRSQNPKAAFDRVDRAEREHNLDSSQVSAFLKIGRLEPLNLELKAEKKAPPAQAGGGEKDAGR